MHHPLMLEGEELWLLPDKAVYWPARRCLLIADAHFGKASAYRSLGQPVPQGTTTANLERLDRLLTALPCAQLIFLGDFLHGPGSHASGTLNAIRAWRERNRPLALTLIRGNHDKRAGDPPLDLSHRRGRGASADGPFRLATRARRTRQPPCTGGACASGLPPARQRAPTAPPAVLPDRRSG